MDSPLDYGRADNGPGLDGPGSSVEKSGPLLTAVVPALNEQATIAQLLEATLANDYSPRVLVVDDGSTDDTGSIAAGVIGKESVLTNRSGFHGKGSAVTVGLTHVDTPLVVVQDADLEYDPSDLSLLVEQFRLGVGNERVPLSVFGRRTRTKTNGRFVNDLGIAFLNRWVSFCGGVATRDHATCYKMLPTRVLRLLDVQARGFDWCGEVCVKLGRLANFLGDDWPERAVREVAVNYLPRTSDEGKKLRLWHGWPVARTIWRWRHWTPPMTPQEARLQLCRAEEEIRVAFADVLSGTGDVSTG